MPIKTSPIIQLKNVCKEFHTENEPFFALDSIDLEIHAGQFVAIVGASGSGKTTLLNILGCMDKPSTGQYILEGQDLTDYSVNQLAEIRRESFGFIFQKYNLISDLSALENVEIPAVYAGHTEETRKKDATDLLVQMGLADRLNHLPHQLSGGQQQRTGIARALINKGKILLADEPTGALDSTNGNEILNIIKALNQSGYTVIMVTHDMELAQNAHKIITLKDSKIVGVKKNRRRTNKTSSESGVPKGKYNNLVMLRNALESTKKQLLRHKARTCLAMIGVIIGIAAYVTAVCIGQGTTQKIIEDISSLGNSAISVSEGNNPNNVDQMILFTQERQGFSEKDLDAIKAIPYVHSLSPVFDEYSNVTLNDYKSHTNVIGINQDYFYIKNLTIKQGQNFSDIAISNGSRIVILGEYLAKKIAKKSKFKIGDHLLIGQIPFKIIGITKESAKGRSRNAVAYIPYTAVSTTINPRSDQINNFIVRMTDDRYIGFGINKIKSVFQVNHPNQSINATSNDTFLQSLSKTNRTLDIFTYVISFVCLFVGGICVTNTMLVSVNERLFEIGVRMAVGARPVDILVQFIAESFVICLFGGILGCILAVILCYTIHFFFSNMYFIFLAKPFFLAFIFSSTVGIISGFYPARNASLRSPIHILNNE